MRIKSIFLSLILLIAFASPVLAEDLGTIKVSGYGELSIRPDTCSIEFVIISKHEDQLRALEENTRKNKDLVDSFFKAGLAEKDLVTSDYSISPSSEYDSQGVKLKDYYLIRNSLEVTIRDLDKIGSFIALGLEAGADSVGYLNYSSSRADQAYNRALELAIRDARAKVELMTKTLGLDLKRISSLEETSSSNYGGASRDYKNLDAFKEMASPDIQVGDLSIRASVNMEAIY